MAPKRKSAACFFNLCPPSSRGTPVRAFTPHKRHLVPCSLPSRSARALRVNMMEGGAQAGRPRTTSFTARQESHRTLSSPCPDRCVRSPRTPQPLRAEEKSSGGPHNVPVLFAPRPYVPSNHGSLSSSREKRRCRRGKRKTCTPCTCPCRMAARARVRLACHCRPTSPFLVRGKAAVLGCKSRACADAQKGGGVRQAKTDMQPYAMCVICVNMRSAFPPLLVLPLFALAPGFCDACAGQD